MPLLKLLFVLHHVRKILSSSIKRWTVKIIVFFLLALIVLEDFIARLGTLGKNHLLLHFSSLDVVVIARGTAATNHLVAS